MDGSLKTNVEWKKPKPNGTQISWFYLYQAPKLTNLLIVFGVRIAIPLRRGDSGDLVMFSFPFWVLFIVPCELGKKLTELCTIAIYIHFTLYVLSKNVYLSTLRRGSSKGLCVRMWAECHRLGFLGSWVWVEMSIRDTSEGDFLGLVPQACGRDGSRIGWWEKLSCDALRHSAVLCGALRLGSPSGSFSQKCCQVCPLSCCGTNHSMRLPLKEMWSEWGWGSFLQLGYPKRDIASSNILRRWENKSSFLTRLEQQVAVSTTHGILSEDLKKIRGDNKGKRNS